MEFDPLLLRKFLLFELELCSQIEQAQFFLLFGDHFIQERQVVAEKKNGRRIIHFGVLANITFKEDRCHWRDVLVAEAEVSTREAGITRLYRPDSYTSAWVYHVAGENFLRQRHRTLASCNRRQKNFLLHARHIKWKKSAILDDLARDLVLAQGEFAEWNLLPCTNLIDQRKIR